MRKFANTAKTTILLAGIGGVLVVLGQLFFGGRGAFIGLGLGLLICGASYWFSDRIAVRAAGGQPVTEADAPRLYRIVKDLSEDAGIPMPKLYVTPDPQPNAFATGRNPRHAAVACTAGIMKLLDDDELRGVIAHELSHVKNRDILISSVAAAVAMGITFLARFAMFGALFGGGRDDDDNGGNVLQLLLLAMLAPLAAGMLQMALSRSREYEADRTGAELIGDGEALARSLLKIEAYAKQAPMHVDPALATAYIINPLSGRKVNFANLFRTHPPTEDRVRRLREMTGSRDFR